MTVFPLIKSPELVGESVLGFEGDGDDLGWLPLPAALENEIGTGIMTIVPCGLDEDAPGMAVAGLGNGPLSLAIPGRALGRDEAKVGHESSGGSEATDIVDFTQKRHGRQRLHSSEATESLDLAAVGGNLGVSVDLGIESIALHLEILEVLEFGAQGCVQGAFELVAELREPGMMFLGPQRPAVTVDEAVGAKDTKDATLGGLGVLLVGIPKTKELA
jgi:hypothetical protein